VGKSGKNFNNYVKHSNMFIGEYIHTIDEKSRTSLPFKFRKEIGKNVVITPGLDQCLFIFSASQWARVCQQLCASSSELSFLKADQRSFNRMMFGQASEVEVDLIGRILIPDFLKEIINLSGKAAIVGVGDRIEIWNEKTWSQYKKKTEKEASQLAEKLSQKGQL
jgi:MraZ protein